MQVKEKTQLLFAQVIFTKLPLIILLLHNFDTAFDTLNNIKKVSRCMKIPSFKNFTEIAFLF